ncbi:MAG: vitamin K epoxide reductase family protein [Candidatus Nanohaloarchaea archaeon]|nr:vitamin K epoxide reductase family protein [Candidatus Nanohaloarchaea archaeon]
MERDQILKWTIGLSIVGLIIATYQTYEHYFLASAICDLSKTFSCSTVTGSRFGSFPPGSSIATALWGMAWWIGLIGLSGATLRGINWFKNQLFYIFAYVATGTVFIAYLLVVELYILPQETGALVICPFCTIQHILILIILFLTYGLLQKPVKDHLTDIFYTEA